MADAWSPDQYAKFRDERMQPFFDLVALIRKSPDMKAIDLGCGPGELTKLLSERLDAQVLGIDSSEAMIAKTPPFASERVTFRLQGVEEQESYRGLDLVFSHATLQWVPGNEALLAKILGELAPGAQIAVQVPKNEAHPSHALAEEVAREKPFAKALGGFVRRTSALTLERYAEILHEHGFTRQSCLEKIYGHTLASADEVVEWTRGTLLTAYLSRLDEEMGKEFLAVYRQRVLSALGHAAPYFYPFRRLLFWGEKG